MLMISWGLFLFFVRYVYSRTHSTAVSSRRAANLATHPFYEIVTGTFVNISHFSFEKLIRYMTGTKMPLKLAYINIMVYLVEPIKF